MGFLSFLAAEVLGLSGIFAILFCGITMRWVRAELSWRCKPDGLLLC